VTKRKANKVKVGDILNVPTKWWYYVGSGKQVKTVTVVKVVSKDAEGNLPLFVVELPDGTHGQYTYKFFE
tara:strand:+ start:44 stop:253 length:210 start_codon:yes stop_codon:yes gene_type:complete